MVSLFAKEFKVTKTQATDMCQFVLDKMTETAFEDGYSVFNGHRFTRKLYKARKGRNPQTGAVIEIPEKIKLVYKTRDKS